MILGRTVLAILLAMQVGLVPVAQAPENEVTIDTTTNNYQTNEDYCNFCDDHELTTKEKCEELLWKCLTDEKNWLDDGIITKEVYELQIEPFNEALDYLELGTATDEEIEELYKQFLLANLDWLEEDKAAGEEIDEGFYDYISSELKKYN